MKKLSLFIIFLFIGGLQIFSQQIFNDYIITLENDTVYGNIKEEYKFQSVNFITFTYSKKNSNIIQIEKLLPSQINAYCCNNIHYYSKEYLDDNNVLNRFCEIQIENRKVEEVGKEITSSIEENKVKIKYPDFACELNAGTNYTHLFIPQKLINAISGNGGLFNLNAGIGFKFRLKNKIYMGFGYGYWENSLDQNYQATYEYNNDSSVVYDIAEEGRVCNKGAYVYIGQEREKMFFRLGLSMGFFTQFNGDRIVYNKTAIISNNKIAKDNYIITDKYIRDLKIFLKFGYNKKYSPNLIVKPYLSVSYSFSPAYHTWYFITKDNDNDKELNMHFATFSLGISVDVGMALPK